MHFKEAPFLEIPTQKIDIKKRTAADGAIYLKSWMPLESHPYRMTERLVFWAEYKSETVFLGQRNDEGEWQTITYAETLKRVRKLAQWLLDQNISVDNPVAIIAENSIEHALMALAALHIGIPYSSISPAYITKSKDYRRLNFMLETLTPGVIMVSNGTQSQDALQRISHHAKVVYLNHKPQGGFEAVSFSDALKTAPTDAVESAYQAIQPDTIAKVLFTSGSTGLSKGVINTHNNITTNWQQIVQVFPFMEEGFQLLDWLPWNHTFGGNHNLGLTLYNGGSLYIDGGNPTPEGIETTIKNLREIAPTIYFNVPRGFEDLIPRLKADKKLREQFFSKLKLLFYAGAGMAQHVWDELEELAFQTIGKRILIATGLGCTEASPSAMFNTHFGSFAGMLGVPVPGLELKLVEVAGKLEARYKGENIMPGYWRNEEATEAAFDEEGYYKTGDALTFVDPEDPNAGMIFDGRIAEDFKLNSGTWVSVGSLRTNFIKAANGLIQDLVITGHDRAYLGAIVFPDPNVEKTRLKQELGKVLEEFARKSKGSSTLIKKILIAPFVLSPENNEVTDKGSINQRAVLTNRGEYVEMIYTDTKNELIIELTHSLK